MSNFKNAFPSVPRASRDAGPHRREAPASDAKTGQVILDFLSFSWSGLHLTWPVHSPAPHSKSRPICVRVTHFRSFRLAAEDTILHRLVASPGGGHPELPKSWGGMAMMKSKNRFPRNAFESERPKIVLRKGRSHEAVDHAEEVLLEHCFSLGIFQRAGELMRIITLPEGHADNALSRPRGTVQLENLTSTSLTETFNRIARWKGKSRGQTVRIDCLRKSRHLTLHVWGLGGFQF